MKNNSLLSKCLIVLIIVAAAVVVWRLIELLTHGEFWSLIVAALVTFALIIIYQKVTTGKKS